MTRSRVYIYPSGLGCAFGLFAVLVLAAMYAAIAVAWILWAVVVLVGAGIARLSGRPELARRMGETLMWDLKALRE
jgi:hypothetical protein